MTTPNLSLLVHIYDNHTTVQTAKSGGAFGKLNTLPVGANQLFPSAPVVEDNSVYLIEGHDFTSDAIYFVAYNGANRELAVSWKTNTEAVYVYENIPLELLTRFLAAKSKGSFVSSQIVGKQKLSRITNPAEFTRNKLFEAIGTKTKAPTYVREPRNASNPASSKANPGNKQVSDAQLEQMAQYIFETLGSLPKFR
jgi:hypothetical protein